MQPLAAKDGPYHGNGAVRALVTGGTGFIGSAVVRCLLSEGHTVTVFSRSETVPIDLRDERVTVARGDLVDPSSLLRALEGTDVLYHIGEIRNITKAAAEKNVELMEAVVPKLGPLGIGRTVFASSITVSGIPSSFPADEETPPRVILRDHYTAYKRRCEEILAASARGQYAIIRPAPVYGPGSRYLVRLISAIERFGPWGIPFAGSGENNVLLIFVSDLARAIYQAGVIPEAAGQTFILSDGVRHSWREFLTGIAALMGKRLRLLAVPPFLLKIPTVPIDILAGFFGVDMDALTYLDYLSSDLFFDSSKTRGLLQWQPEYSLQRGIAEMMAYYRERRAQFSRVIFSHL